MKYGFLLFCLGLSSLAAAAAAESPDDLSQIVGEIFRKNCASCHANGRTSGGPQDLTREEFLKFVDLDNPRASTLYVAVKNGDMPLGRQRLPASQVASILKWIEAGAPDFNKEPKINRPSDEKMIELMLEDIKSVPARQRPHIRYITLAHLFRGGISNDHRHSTLEGVAFLLNALSYEKKVTTPKIVDADGALLRIDISAYGWSRQWQTLESVYPYRIENVLPSSQDLQKQTKTAVPFIRGDWFIQAASTAPLYYDLLALPDQVAKLEKKFKINILKDIRDGEAMRAGFSKSGVSQNNRTIERHATEFGAFWQSYDFASSERRGDIFNFPLGPLAAFESRAFSHDGGEYIFHLPNGLLGFYISNAKGQRLDRAPINIVSDPLRADKTIVAGQSCFSCHFNGLIPRVDEVAIAASMNPELWEKDEFENIKSLYGRTGDLAKAFLADNKRYGEAFKKIKLTSERESPITKGAFIYGQELSLDDVIAELSTGRDELIRALPKLTPAQKLLLSKVFVPNGSLERKQFESVFIAIYAALHAEEGTHTPPTTPQDDPEYSDVNEDLQEKPFFDKLVKIFQGKNARTAELGQFISREQVWRGECVALYNFGTPRYVRRQYFLPVLRHKTPPGETPLIQFSSIDVGGTPYSSADPINEPQDAIEFLRGWAGSQISVAAYSQTHDALIADYYDKDLIALKHGVLGDVKVYLYARFSKKEKIEDICYFDERVL